MIKKLTLSFATALFLSIPFAHAQELPTSSSIAGITLDEEVSAFKERIENGTLEAYLDEHKDTRAQLIKLKQNSQSGLLQTAMENDPSTRQYLLDAGIIDETNHLSKAVSDVLPEALAPATTSESSTLILPTEPSTSVPTKEPTNEATTGATESTTPSLILPTEPSGDVDMTPKQKDPEKDLETNPILYWGILGGSVGLVILAGLACWWVLRKDSRSDETTNQED